MRRLASRVAARTGGAFFRLSRALYRPPEETRTQAWIRDQGDRTLRLDYDLDTDSVVFDLGGYEGQWASDIQARYACTLHVFEPVPEFAERIANRFRANSRVTVHRFGLAERTGSAALTLSADATSLYGSAPRGSGGGLRGESRTIELVRAADFFRDHRIAGVDLMKINIEGGEYDLLDHLIAAGLVDRIRNIQVQFHDFVPDARGRMESLQDRLRPTHEPTWQYPFVWENWRRKAGSGGR